VVSAFVLAVAFAAGRDQAADRMRTGCKRNMAGAKKARELATSSARRENGFSMAVVATGEGHGGDAAASMDVRVEGRPYRGMSPQARRAERRRRLLDSAMELFGTVGYAATSIEEICRAAGVTTRHFYEEYASREELLRAVYTEIAIQSVKEVTEAIQSAPMDFEARVRAGIEAYVRPMLTDPRRARIFCLEAVGVSPAMEAHRRSVLHIMASMTQHYAEELRMDEPVRFPEGWNFGYNTLALVGAINELMAEWVAEGPKVSLEELIDIMVGIYVAVGAPLLGLAPPVALSSGAQPAPPRSLRVPS